MPKPFGFTPAVFVQASSVYLPPGRTSIGCLRIRQPRVDVSPDNRREVLPPCFSLPSSSTSDSGFVAPFWAPVSSIQPYGAPSLPAFSSKPPLASGGGVPPPSTRVAIQSAASTLLPP